MTDLEYFHEVHDDVVQCRVGPGHFAGERQVSGGQYAEVLLDDVPALLVGEHVVLTAVSVGGASGGEQVLDESRDDGRVLQVTDQPQEVVGVFVVLIIGEQVIPHLRRTVGVAVITQVPDALAVGRLVGDLLMRRDRRGQRCSQGCVMLLVE